MDAFLVINCSLDALLMLISITANALILSAIFRTPSLRSPSTIFLCSLAVSDLLVGLVVQPVYIANELTSSNSLLHRSANIVLGIACSVSLFTMTAISVDRFLALRYHMRYPTLMTEKRAICTTVTIWFICIVAPSLSLSHNRHGVFALGIVICIFISTFSYIRIYQIVRQHQLQIQAQQQAVQTDHNLNHARSTKTAINTFIFYACMILYYTPMFVFMLILAFYPFLRTNAWLFAETVTFMNSSINPFLFCWRLRELRATVLKTLRALFGKDAEVNP